MSSFNTVLSTSKVILEFSAVTASIGFTNSVEMWLTLTSVSLYDGF